MRRTSVPMALNAKNQEAERLARLLETEVWPLVPEALGRALRGASEVQHQARVADHPPMAARPTGAEAFPGRR